VRDAFHWELARSFSRTGRDGDAARPLKAVAHARLEDVAGSLRVTGPARTIAEMDAAIVAEVRRRRDRGRY
jgi:hypothetical protein